MRFQVPQFIEHEPKVIGPLTFRQFVYLGVPAAIGFFLYFLAPLAVFVAVTLVVGLIGAALAFYKVEGRSLPGFLAGALAFVVRPKQYRWKKGVAAPEQKTVYKQDRPTEKEPRKVALQKQSRVQDLATRVETRT